MSRRIFKAVARGIKNSTVGIDGISRELMIQNVACELAQVYPGFDTNRFTEACRPDVAPINSPSNKR
jgi:hypothetical protein